MEETIASIIEQYRNEDGALLPLLHAVQNALGYISGQSIIQIARALQKFPTDFGAL